MTCVHNDCEKGLWENGAVDSWTSTMLRLGGSLAWHSWRELGPSGKDLVLIFFHGYERLCN